MKKTYEYGAIMIEDKIKVVTICGSMKFAKDMLDIATELERRYGWCVLQCVYDFTGRPVTKEELDKIKLAHYKRIDIADAIFVVNKGGYIGESVRKEIEYATKHNKEILYLE